MNIQLFIREYQGLKHESIDPVLPVLPRVDPNIRAGETRRNSGWRFYSSRKCFEGTQVNFRNNCS